MKLSDFICAHMDEILQHWDAFARKIAPPGNQLSARALRDHAQTMLVHIARGMRESQTPEEQRLKSEGGGQNAGSTVSAAAEHGIQRQTKDFTLLQLSAEFRALRATVLRLWLPTVPQGDLDTVRDLMRFNEGIDQALAESIVSYSKRTQQTRDLFLAVLGHDLRSPLAGILLAGDMLAQGDVRPEKVAQLGANLARSAHVMRHIVDDLIGYTRSQLAEGLPTAPEDCDLRQVLESAIADATATYPGNRFELRAAQGLVGRYDPTRLYQMFLNLLVNAGRHSRDQAPVIVQACAEADAYVVDITNQGEPIPPDKLESIFRPLVQLSDEDGVARSGTSLGLGLFIAREVARVHDGSITASSSASDGTTFTVTLPRSEAGEERRAEAVP
ncbi:sensor histidine kinase [Frateuria terrea]|uniref:histidine kinase n=1 Tax=Frateuria terrea TaxID=529704 RepID=A0A1H6ZSC5_9GAMM|nr:HAMP domain-containing sensor histidine kinase [Frateuria terrea]SEJ51675.1 Signal transduction histidine kinase [Frateuria terrea]SFP79612.1 Signal transduction histidine kinase [Frateuria terrea]